MYNISASEVSQLFSNNSAVDTYVIIVIFVTIQTNRQLQNLYKNILL